LKKTEAKQSFGSEKEGSQERGLNSEVTKNGIYDQGKSHGGGRDANASQIEMNRNRSGKEETEAKTQRGMKNEK